jgi:hypothetical protein
MSATQTSEPSRMSAADPLERGYRLYRKRIARCRTPNQRNRIHLALESYMTPLEVRYFALRCANDPPDSPERRWVERLDAYMPRRPAARPEFVRRGTLRAVSQYTAEAGSRSDKTLLVCFAGVFHRLMLPTSAFLDCLDASRYDVVLLRDFTRTAFSKGIERLGRDFFETMGSLRTGLEPAAYARTVALGVCSGAMPAMLASILLGFDHGISIAGVDFPEFASWLAEWGVDARRHEALLDSRLNPLPDLLLVYSADTAKDAAAAKALQRRLPSRLWAEPDCAVHVLPALLASGRLPSFMSRLLESDEGIGAAPSRARIAETNA